VTLAQLAAFLSDHGNACDEFPVEGNAPPIAKCYDAEASEQPFPPLQIVGGQFTAVPGTESFPA